MAALIAPLVDYLVDGKLAKQLDEAELSDETKRIISETVGEDSFVVIASLQGPPDIIGANATAPTAEDVKTQNVDLCWKRTGEAYEDVWEKVKVRSVKKKISDEFTIEILAEHDVFTEYSSSERIVSRVYNSRIVFPLHDLDGSIDDEVCSRFLKEDTGSLDGKIILY
jgi:hypothetical protein